MKKIFILLALGFVLALSAKDAVRTDFFQVNTNWTQKELFATVDEVIPNVVFDPDDPDYGKEDTAYNLTEARNFALQKAKKRLNILLFRGIENLPLNSAESVKDAIKTSDEFKQKYNEIFQTNSISYSVKYKKNRVYVAGKFKFTGRDGLLYYLDMKFFEEEFPEFQKMESSPEYTGLIIDARHLDAHPALYPRILSDRGLEIYTYRHAEKSSALNKGIVTYMTDPVEAMKHSALIGKKPFYIRALNSAGKGMSDLVIQSEDAKKLLASEKTRSFLKKCRVIILIK